MHTYMLLYVLNISIQGTYCPDARQDVEILVIRCNLQYIPTLFNLRLVALSMPDRILLMKPQSLLHFDRSATKARNT
jgi:hypothetical protein